MNTLTAILNTPIVLKKFADRGQLIVQSLQMIQPSGSWDLSVLAITAESKFFISVLSNSLHLISLIGWKQYSKCIVATFKCINNLKFYIHSGGIMTFLLLHTSWYQYLQNKEGIIIPSHPSANKIHLGRGHVQGPMALPPKFCSA